MSSPRPGHVVCVYAPKGGVGKSAIAVNLAVALRRRTGQPVTLIDMAQPCGALELYLDLSPPRTICDVLALGGELDEDVLGQAIAPHASGVGLIAGPRPDGADGLACLSAKPLLQALTREPGWVVIDLGTQLDAAHVSALTASDLVVVPFTPQLASVGNMPRVRAFLAGLGVPAERLVPVFNQPEYGGAPLSPGLLDRLTGATRRLALPDAGHALAWSLDEGRPFVDIQPESPLGRAFTALAHRVLVELGQADQAEVAPPVGVLRRVQGLIGRAMTAPRLGGDTHVRA